MGVLILKKVNTINKQCFQLYYISFILGVSCGVPPDGTNTVPVPLDNFVYQQVYTYSCITGYVTKEPATTECLADRSWSLNKGPNCTSK